MKYFRHLSYAIAFGISCLSGSAQAAEIDAPVGEVVLTITGAIAVTNQHGAAAFDMEMLAGLGSETIETTTIWTDGMQTFEGVPLYQIVETLGVEDGTLIATAINDYSVEIPTQDAIADGPIIAFSQNGAAMSVRDKGPLWIVYPYDSDPRYKSEVIYARSIWQLDRIEVRREEE